MSFGAMVTHLVQRQGLVPLGDNFSVRKTFLDSPSEPSTREVLPARVRTLNADQTAPIRDAFLDDDWLGSVLKPLGAIYRHPNIDNFATTEEGEPALVRQFFREVPMAAGAISFAHATRIPASPKLRVGGRSWKLNELGGADLIASTLRDPRAQDLGEDVDKLREHLSRLGIAVTSDAVDRAIWSWELKQIDEELRSHGIYLDHERNIAYVIDPDAHDKMNGIRVPKIMGNNVKRESFRKFPNARILQKLIGKDKLVSMEDYRKLFAFLGFHVATRSEIRDYVLEKDSPGNIFWTGKVETTKTTDAHFNAKVARLIAASDLEARGYQNIEFVDLSDGGRRYGTTPYAIKFENDRGENYLALVTGTTLNREQLKDRNGEFDARAAVLFNWIATNDPFETKNYRPLFVHVFDMDRENLTGKIDHYQLRANNDIVFEAQREKAA